MLRTFFLACCLAAAAVWAERPEVGVRVGWPLVPPYTGNDYIEPATCAGVPCANFESAGRRAAVGLSVRVPLTERLALRLMPGWQRISFDYSGVHLSLYSEATTGNRWELAAVAEWRAAAPIRPGLGAVVSTVAGERSFSKLVVPPGLGTAEGYTNVFPLNKIGQRTIGGLIADVEFPFRWVRASIAPDVRYTRWFSKHFGYRGRAQHANGGPVAAVLKPFRARKRMVSRR